MLEALLVGFHTVPFSSPYIPLHNPKLLWPLSLAGLFAAPLLLAATERAAFISAASAFELMAVLAIGTAGIRYVRNRTDSAAAAFAFEGLPETPTQRLGLSERIIN